MPGSSRINVPFTFEAEHGVRSFRVRTRFDPSTQSAYSVVELELEPDGAPAFVALFELREKRFEPCTASELELRDVNAFLQHEFKSAACADSWQLAPSPQDPPDLIASSASLSVGIECAQVLWPSQLSKTNIAARNAMFERLRERLLKESAQLGRRLRKHKGQLVMLQFQYPGNNRLPPRARDLDALVEHLATVERPKLDPVVDKAAVATEVPVPGVVMNEDRSIGCSWTPLPDDWSGTLYRIAGFEIGLAYSETYTRDAVRERLAAVIHDHDDPSNDLLVLSVAAPTKQGFYFPTTGLLADMLFDDPDPIPTLTPVNLKAIVLHDQSKRRTRWLLGASPLG